MEPSLEELNVASSPSEAPPLFPDAVRSYEKFALSLQVLQKSALEKEAGRSQRILRILDRGLEQGYGTHDAQSRCDDDEQRHWAKYLPGLLQHARNCFEDLRAQCAELGWGLKADFEERKAQISMIEKIEALLEAGYNVMLAGQTILNLALVALDSKKKTNLRVPSQSPLTDAMVACEELTDAMKPLDSILDTILEDSALVYKGRLNEGDSQKEASNMSIRMQQLRMLESMWEALEQAQECRKGVVLYWRAVQVFSRHRGGVDKEDFEVLDRDKDDLEARLKTMEDSMLKAAKGVLKGWGGA
ncbi:hypothetical protein BU26DRAFT_594186 [Trematosphaeria pertusa]|uniref:Uncharacterized protein n=1 Tax=Trematosphaeria pertusa TaxID=390896 RepID=A0A6A6IJ12_9PLEO|nr:uncharacterized protein BU26DRAFT_594186 [Trematosphaeria pertusa]KAF2250366.1 hypothetical protein BU26DRAFT_594186 [Trematosphaeria pertusa]